MAGYRRTVVLVITTALLTAGLLTAATSGGASAATFSTLSIGDVIVSESSSSVTVPVTLSAPSASSVTVWYTTANGTAFNGSDYTGKQAMLTFAPGVRTQNVSVTILRDSVKEGFEYFTVGLSSASGAVVSKSVAQVGVVDNDTVVATPRVLVRDVMVDESVGFATVPVVLGGLAGQASAGTVTVAYATSGSGLEAVAGSDFTSVSGTLTFAAGQTVKNVQVPITNDAVKEGVERFKLTLSSPVGATIAGGGVGIVTIGASDAPVVATPALSVGDGLVGEGDGYVEVPITLSAPSASSVTVWYTTANGTAFNGSDYAGEQAAVVFLPGQTTRAVRLELLDTPGAEGFEYFTVGLSSASGAVVSKSVAQVGVVDNDTVVATPRVLVRDVMVDESVGFATVPVVLGGLAGQASAGTVTVAYATSGSGLEAVAGSDFTSVSGTLTFAAGQTVKNVQVPITNDAVKEGVERFKLTLSSPVGATIAGGGVGIVTIGASDAPVVATPALSVGDGLVGEGDGYVEVPITLSAPSASSVTVWYTTANGTAFNGSDYAGEQAAVVFLPGQTTRAVRLELLDTPGAEGFEYFTVGLSSASGAVVSKSVAQVGVVDNDTVVATPRVLVRDVMVDESVGFATVPVVLGGLAGQASAGTVTVAYATSGSGLEAVAGSDFTSVSGTLTFAAGQTVKNVQVPITNDAVKEGVERFKLTLSSPVGATIAGGGVGIVTIGASDAPVVATPALSVGDGLVGEGDGYVEVPITLSAPSASSVTVWYTTANGTAFNGSDYAGEQAAVVFLPGQTTRAVRLEILDDKVVEPAESFTVGLSSASGATVARSLGHVYIGDND